MIFALSASAEGPFDLLVSNGFSPQAFEAKSYDNKQLQVCYFWVQLYFLLLIYRLSAKCYEGR